MKEKAAGLGAALYSNATERFSHTNKFQSHARNIKSIFRAITHQAGFSKADAANTICASPHINAVFSSRSS